jgi:tetratricopeptide (TPR) repeat protein
LHVVLFAAFLNRNQREFAEIVKELAVQKTYGESEHCQSLTAAYEGRIHQSRQLSDQAINLARQAHYPERAALSEGAAAIRDAVLGYPADAVRHAAAAKQLATGRDVDFPPAFALALSQNLTAVRHAVMRLDKDFPEDTCVRFNYSPTLHALLEMGQGNPARAIEILTIAKTYEFAQTGVSLYAGYGALYPEYVRGLAYQQWHKPREAAVEFRKILDHPGILLADPIAPSVRLQLARVLRDAGDLEQSKAAYREFLDLWKDADDPAIPLLQQAKAEYARL